MSEGVEVDHFTVFSKGPKALHFLIIWACFESYVDLKILFSGIKSRKVEEKIKILSEEKWLEGLKRFNLEKKRHRGDRTSSKHLKHKKKNWMSCVVSPVRMKSNAWELQRRDRSSVGHFKLFHV